MKNPVHGAGYELVLIIGVSFSMLPVADVEVKTRIENVESYSVICNTRVHQFILVYMSVEKEK
jgi:hypothetical protein